jgi:hypothetical protein
VVGDPSGLGTVAAMVVDTAVAPRITLAPGAVHTWPLGDFCRRVAPLSWYRSWSEAFATLEGDAAEREIIDDLVVDHRLRGGFHTPLRVSDDELSNGYHRLCALRRLRRPVRFRVVDDAHPEPGWDDVDTIDVRFTAHPRFDVADDTDETWLWDVISAARSVPTRSRWVESDGGSVHGVRRVVTIHPYASMSEADAITAAITERLDRLGFDVSIVDVTPSEP